MGSLTRVFALIAVAACVPLLPAEDKPPTPAPADDGFKPLFNGKNLDGWVNVNCHPGTFFVKGGEIITTGKPTGFLRTERQYENFVLEMDWMHANKTEVGNSGLFVWGDPLPAVGDVYTRGIEVQVLVNAEYKDKKTGAVSATSHGDLFSIKGAKCTPDRPHPLGWERCLPSENRAKGGGEWNHYKVTANNGAIKLEVNGKEVSGVSKCTPRKGYLALESEGAECHFKNIKIKELPSTNPKPEECAKVAEGHVSLFNGVDLKGWETNDKGKKDWTAKNGTLVAKQSNEPFSSVLSTAKKCERAELVFDWKMPDKAGNQVTVTFDSVAVVIVPWPDKTDLMVAQKDGKAVYQHRQDLKEIKPEVWHRAIVRFDGKNVTATVDNQKSEKILLEKALSAAPIGFDSLEGLQIMNVFVRELKEKK